MNKPREIDAKIGRIRPVGREVYDRRSLTALPSATGGRPSTGAGAASGTLQTEVAAPLAAATGTETAARPLGDISGLMEKGHLRFARRPPGLLPTVNRLNRTLEQYTINNADMVNAATTYFERLAQTNPAVLDGFENAYEAAQWAVAHIARSFEPGDAPRLLDIIHQSRSGRRVFNFLRRIEEALNVES